MFEIILISSLVILAAAQAAGIIMYIRGRNALENRIESQTGVKSDEVEKLRTRVKDLSENVDKFNLKAADLEEFVTRTMNKVSARSSRSAKDLEKIENLQELLQQSAEIEQTTSNGQHSLPFNQEPRLRRRKK